MDLDKLKGKRNISITLDKNLLEKIEKILKEEKILSLSAYINEVLWEKIKNGN